MTLQLVIVPMKLLEPRAWNGDKMGRGEGKEIFLPFHLSFLFRDPQRIADAQQTREAIREGDPGPDSPGKLDGAPTPGPDGCCRAADQEPTWQQPDLFCQSGELPAVCLCT